MRAFTAVPQVPWFVFLCVMWAGCGPRLEPVRAGQTAGSVTATVPHSVDAVISAVLTLVDRKAQTRGTPFERMVAYTSGDPAFPSHGMLAANARSNPELEAYLTRDATERAREIFLFDPTATFWKSEYEVAGRPADFHCNFLINLRNHDGSATEILVLEQAPTVKIGQRFVLFGHEGPGFYEDTRTVAPTNRERATLLELILAQLQRAG